MNKNMGSFLFCRPGIPSWDRKKGNNHRRPWSEVALKNVQNRDYNPLWAGRVNST